jgi:hypothetical protein
MASISSPTARAARRLHRLVHMGRVVAEASRKGKAGRQVEVNQAKAPTETEATLLKGAQVVAQKDEERKSTAAEAVLMHNVGQALFGDRSADKPVTQKVLGLDLTTLNKDLRSKYNTKDSVNSVLITGVDANSDTAHWGGPLAGDVIVEFQEEAPFDPVLIKNRIDGYKRNGMKSNCFGCRAPV